MKSKISIIIPVYNVADYISKCLDSLSKQTLKNIEIIVIDDCSTDNTKNIVINYMSKDNRIILIQNNSNSSAYISRKKGIEKASGKYIMFVDGDDSLEENACEILYSLMEEYKVDILHFGSNITNVEDLPEKRIVSMQTFLKPYDGCLFNEDVFKGCFIEKKYRFTLWNKIFKTSVCKEAASYMNERYLPKGQDKLAYFIISFFANSYKGVPGLSLYNYQFGAGITGHGTLSLEAFKKYCMMAGVAEEMALFLKKVDKNNEYQLALENAKNELLSDTVNQWKNHVNCCESSLAFDEMVATWGVLDTISCVALKYWYKRKDIACSVRDSNMLNQVNDKKIKTIGTFYFRIGKGGAQRVVAQLVNLWCDMGYRVVLFTDCEADEDDYYVCDKVERVVLGSSFENMPSNYHDRAALFIEGITKFHVDAFVHHGWMSPLLLWDLLICKLIGINMYVHTHSVYAFPLASNGKAFLELPFVFSLADGVITLSDADLSYWKNFNDNVFKVANPVEWTFDKTKKIEHDSINILFVGRISYEKHPLEAVMAFKLLHDANNNTRLIMVGDIVDKSCFRQIKQFVQENLLDDEVCFEGFQYNVAKYYAMADIAIITSEYEGFPLSLFESKVCKLPCIMYELPYLEFYKDMRGLYTVPMRDVKALANKLIEIASAGKQFIKEQGELAYASLDWLRNYDYKNTWNSIFLKPIDKVKKINTMWITFFNFYENGVIQTDNYKKYASEANCLRARVYQLEHSYSYQLGLIITFVPRKIVTGVYKLISHANFISRRTNHLFETKGE